MDGISQAVGNVVQAPMEWNGPLSDAELAAFAEFGRALPARTAGFVAEVDQGQVVLSLDLDAHVPGHEGEHVVCVRPVGAWEDGARAVLAENANAAAGILMLGTAPDGGLLYSPGQRAGRATVEIGSCLQAFEQLGFFPRDPQRERWTLDFRTSDKDEILGACTVWRPASATSRAQILFAEFLYFPETVPEDDEGSDVDSVSAELAAFAAAPELHGALLAYAAGEPALCPAARTAIRKVVAGWQAARTAVFSPEWQERRRALRDASDAADAVERDAPPPGWPCGNDFADEMYR